MVAFQPAWIWIGAALLAGLLLGGVIVWLGSRISSQRAQERLRIRLSNLEAENRAKEGELQVLRGSREQLHDENQDLKIRLAQQEKVREAEAEKLQWVEDARRQMRDTFEALAGQTLQRHSGEFLKRAGEQVEDLLNRVKGDWSSHQAQLRHLFEPLHENLAAINSHVRELEQKREGAYRGLEQQLQQLSKAHAELQNTTITLTQALKSPTVRGRWGEMQLRRVVEMAGMAKHITFVEQVSTEGGRPDMIAYLPNGGILPVDSKVPLEAYLEAMEAAGESARLRKLDRHAKAMQNRIAELSRKRYWEQFERNPDFVVMFVPNESCLTAAFENTPSLLEYAMQKRVLLTTPVTLLALLKAVAYGWQQQRMSENARRIAEQGKELYRRLETFVGHLDGVGRELNKAVETYNRAVGSLTRRLLPAARRLEEMGIAEAGMDEPDEVEIQARVKSSEASGQDN